MSERDIERQIEREIKVDYQRECHLEKGVIQSKVVTLVDEIHSKLYKLMPRRGDR